MKNSWLTSNVMSWILLAGWTLLVVFFLLAGIYVLRDGQIQAAQILAETAIEKDILYRRWNAGFGGVYAPVSDSTPPNELLTNVPERDIVTPSGVKLTLINPAYMTRQVHEITRAEHGIQGHITSRNPIRPENAPDDWEQIALDRVDSTGSTYAETVLYEGEPSLRVMTPLVTEKSCLTCHAHQGYEAGDQRGGISVTVPLAPYNAVTREQAITLTVAFAGLWAFVSIILFYLHRTYRTHADTRKQLELHRERSIAHHKLTATISHEFNNPMAVILGDLDIAAQKQLVDRKGGYDTSRIRRQVSKMKRLVRKLEAMEDPVEIDYPGKEKIYSLDEHIDQE
jgi:signal transduction histidine kinase